jgi:hypothetical protein
VLIVSAPFGFFLDVPYGEADGYWCTPVRGPIHRYDSRTGEAQGTALKLMSPDQTAWVKCDLIKDRSKVWSEGEVKAVIKFLNGLEEKSDQP